MTIKGVWSLQGVTVWFAMRERRGWCCRGDCGAERFRDWSAPRTPKREQAAIEAKAVEQVISQWLGRLLTVW